MSVWIEFIQKLRKSEGNVGQIQREKKILLLRVYLKVTKLFGDGNQNVYFEIFLFSTSVIF